MGGHRFKTIQITRSKTQWENLPECIKFRGQALSLKITKYTLECASSKITSSSINPTKENSPQWINLRGSSSVIERDLACQELYQSVNNPQNWIRILRSSSRCKSNPRSLFGEVKSQEGILDKSVVADCVSGV